MYNFQDFLYSSEASYLFDRGIGRCVVGELIAGVLITMFLLKE